MSSNRGRRIAAALVATLCALSVMAYTVTGNIRDTDDEPLIGATVRLLRPDSTRVAVCVANADGSFAFNNVKKGKYIVEATYVGSDAGFSNIAVTDKNVRVPDIRLSEKTTMLAEAVVTGIRTPIKVMEDTVEYAADTYKTQPNAVVEDLLKRLPGVEVGSDGAITANGKTVTKILVDGKEFFSDDPKVASKNLPVNMIDKLQVVDRKSDLARLTGVDDGEEETVINLTVKKGMKNGWFGNAEGGYGTDGRYKGTFNVNRFWNDNQVTLLGGINNINEPGFTDGGSRFRRFGGSNGLTLSHALGLNFNVGNGEIFRVGGDVMFSRTSTRTVMQRNRQYVFTDSTSYVNSWKRSRDRGTNVRADFRIQWNPDSFNTLDIRPNMSYNDNNSWSADSSLTQSGHLVDVTRSRNINSSEGKSWEFGAQLIYNHKFRSRPGRSFSVNARFRSSNMREYENSYSWNKFYLYNDSIDTYDQYADNHTWSNTVSGRLSWTEPLGNVKNGNFLTVAYNFSYRWNNADKLTYDRPVDVPDALYDGWLGHIFNNDDLSYREDLSNQFRNDYMNQDIRAGFKHVDKKTTLDAGVSLVPQMSKSIDLIDANRNITRNVLNVAPYLRYRLKVSKTRSLNLFYRGRSSQPSISQLQPVADNSDPLHIVVGNPSLDPSFSHSLRLRYQDFNSEAQRSVMVMADGSVTQNSIVSQTTFSPTTGGQQTTYVNVNGVWNVMGMAMFSMPFRNRDFVFNTHVMGRYAHNVGFNNGERNNQGSLRLNFMPALAWRPENIELEIRPRYSVQLTTNSLRKTANSTIHTYGGMFNGTYYTPFGLVLSTDLNYASTKGYSEGYNSNQCLWNASLAYRFLPDQSLTLSLKAYDLLQQRKNIMRTDSGNYTDETIYNSLTRYFMVTVAWKFNTFGKGNEPKSRNQRRYGPPGGGPGGPGRHP